ncbi:prepilin peptidase-dependent pilin [Erwinia psidii]|uniref:Prepilin peptidase-dependent pilin n=1 Tax=Erwinia psidii TaxID=69224 RepID=A0A3N6SP77_9GAMM|nr:prepilin peptidase-dependent pilin [Erwinia psidii]MCX8957577.1 prepilin peptidase-dependent pilin [Erwinia psidii]MCX8960631.1 prepilin peptidase-dependent pilin [Erwinia psidii]MCX8964124.1 prepilin peptidase-dependent pilin [Erwinia psidii]RQM39606.1 prepilin peptidase-dependent pilin [Erwinia psidii]
MKMQQGFTLIELMIVIAIIAILSAIGLPAYQNYLQKAALTDMLQAAMPFKTAIEICAIEHGSTGDCSAGSNGIPSGKGSRYVSTVTVQAGTVTLIGQESLNGLTVTLKPVWDRSEGLLSWQRSCTSSQDGLKEACNAVFRFDDETSGDAS